MPAGAGRPQGDLRAAAREVLPDGNLETLAKFNAEGRPIWKPMHAQPIYRDHAFVAARDGEDVGADIFRRGLCLPSDIKMTEEEQASVIELIRRCFD